jgi:4,5-DOPA dioxygenase extradiol
MNAIETNAYTESWVQLARSMPKPRAVLVVSAHWFVRGTRVTAMERPRTIHDFGGFPRALFETQYPAPGDVALAERVRDLLAPTRVELDQSWGLDHGAWSVLIRMYPEADVPVIQLSIDGTRPASYHYDLAARLAPLRDEGVFILGSGNVVHNLELVHPEAEPYDWAERFEDAVRTAIAARDHVSLIHYERYGRDASLAVPTPEHYLPMLYVLAQQGPAETATTSTDDVIMRSISMLSVVVR